MIFLLLDRSRLIFVIFLCDCDFFVYIIKQIVWYDCVDHVCSVCMKGCAVSDNEDLKARLDNLIRIGIALSSETNVDVLLEMIVDESRRLTRADGGTLYIVRDDAHFLDWKILQNDTLDTRMGGANGIPIEKSGLPPVPLIVDGQINLKHVSAYVANTGETVNIPDVYEAEGYDFAGTRRYDDATGYRSQSMLVTPLRNHDGDIIGVLQLLNAKDALGERWVPFSGAYENFITSLASQAAVAITNAKLIQNLSQMFNAFIETTATAIDEKSPYTAGHVRRVSKLTMMIAEAINQKEDGLWGRIKFSLEELEELRIAAWMHDVGKMTTPEYVVDKATKLETIYDRIEIVKTRYEVFKRDVQIAILKEKCTLPFDDHREARCQELDAQLQTALMDLQAELDFVVRCNMGGEFMEDADLARLKEIASNTFDLGGQKHPRLTESEIYNLSIRKGTLTNEERQVINNHAAVSIKMLSQLPFSKGLRHVPQYAGGHHEKLNGKGYPKGLAAIELPLQARILAVADVFEALTASDRPYRKPIPLSQALRIIGFMVKDGELDMKIVDLLKESGLIKTYAQEELVADQIDV